MDHNVLAKLLSLLTGTSEEAMENKYSDEDAANMTADVNEIFAPGDIFTTSKLVAWSEENIAAIVAVSTGLAALRAWALTDGFHKS